MLSPLDKKLFRDLWRVKGQAIAIMLVIASGVTLMVMMDGMVNSLTDTRDTYYERYRLAEVFAPVKRAPAHMVDRVADLDGVLVAEGRINAAGQINLPGIDVPVRMQAVSLPEHRQPGLNAVYLSAGRHLQANQRDEVLLLESFAREHELAPGDRMTVTMNGARHQFHIVGLAQSPEFLYTTPPGELVPDEARFAVVWMNQKALAAVFDLDGAVNEILLRTSRDVSETGIITELDRLLSPYGGLGAYSLDDHLSNRFIVDEINSLRVSSRTVPPVFLGVAAFLLYIVISRMVQVEREQIGLLKAFGYSSVEIGGHYFKFVVLIAAGGALLGCLMGVWLGHSLSGFYQLYYKFPFLVFSVDPSAFVIGFVSSVAAASAASLLVLRRAFNLPAAEAMRPPAPPDYSASLQIPKPVSAWLDQPSRMMLRSVLRQPARAMLATLGIAAGMSLSVAMLSVMSAFDRTISLSFDVIDRSDVTVTFIEPLGSSATFSLQSLDGVFKVEPFRSVSVLMRNGVHDYRGSITALSENPALYRAVDVSMQAIDLPTEGIVLSRSLAEQLAILPGQWLTIEIREGRRPVIEVPVISIADTLLGSPAFMSIETLNRLLKEPGRVSGAYLSIDQQQSQRLYRQLKDMPAVAGVTLREESRSAIREVMDTGAGAMRFIMTAIAAVISFGVVYNTARISFAERARDLASLRVLGLSRSETGFVLLGELALIALLALPVGCLLGYFLTSLIAEAFSTDLYRIPVAFVPASYGLAMLGVVVAAVVSGILLQRDIHRLDLVSALKIRE